MYVRVSERARECVRVKGEWIGREGGREGESDGGEERA